LRPWFYKKNEVSRPALTNERVNVDILDKNGKIWFLSIVGGMVVGSIELLEKCNLGIEVLAGDELAVFYLGSTLCLASPICLKLLPYLNKVRVGEKLPTC
jgi:phosphatidylserine decarboxylase